MIAFDQLINDSVGLVGWTHSKHYNEILLFHGAGRSCLCCLFPSFGHAQLFLHPHTICVRARGLASGPSRTKENKEEEFMDVEPNGYKVDATQEDQEINLR